MNVLWITNDLLPEATSQLGGDGEQKRTGSWVYALALALQRNSEIKISIASITKLTKKLKVICGEFITYYAIPSLGGKVYHTQYEKVFREIYKIVAPDVVHIHGTEYTHSLAALRACGYDRTVVSLQGIVSSIAPFYLGGISQKMERKCVTFRSLFRPSLMKEQQEMTKRGEYEKQLFKECRFIIGRTSWDRAQVWSINPKIVYFHCDEALRPEFYHGQWEYHKCTPHSIFTSQGHIPLKGLHMLIKAMSLVIRHYPDVQLRVAGLDFLYDNGSFKDRLRLSSYGKLIKCLIRDYGLNNHVTFTGRLNGQEMKREYLNCNLFVCPSSIENSPNSLGEAQMLGTPVLSSYVGGIPDMMKGMEDCLYRYEDTEMLAYKICTVFEKKENIETGLLRNNAHNRHNLLTIESSLLDIYKHVMESD